MSLSFGAANSHVDFSIGNAAQFSNGALTIVALWKMPASSLNSGFVSGFSGATEQRAFGVDTAHLFGDGDFSSGFGTLSANDWYWVGLSKPAGSNVYRMHFRDYTTAGAWSHGVAVGAANHTDPGTSNAIHVASSTSFTSSTGDVAVAAIWTSVLPDLTIEAACTSALIDLMAQSPQWATRYMQSAPTSIQDLTGGGGNETSRTGTITTTADPPAFIFDLATAVGAKSTNRHPGNSPGKARFFQSPRATNTGGNTVNIDGSLTVTANRTATVAVTHTVAGSLTVTANRAATVAVTHTVGGSLVVTANRTASIARIANIAGSLVVTANRSATIAVTHTIAGSLVVTANRTATVAVTHTIGGTRVTTVNRTATVAVTHTIAGSLVITAARTAAIAVTHTIGGTRVTTVNRTATVAVTHTIGGTRVITVNRIASVGVNIDGTRVTTVNRTAAIAITHTVSGTRPITVGLSADINVSGGNQGLFLPFF